MHPPCTHTTPATPAWRPPAHPPVAPGPGPRPYTRHRPAPRGGAGRRRRTYRVDERRESWGASGHLLVREQAFDLLYPLANPTNNRNSKRIADTSVPRSILGQRAPVGYARIVIRQPHQALTLAG